MSYFVFLFDFTFSLFLVNSNCYFVFCKFLLWLRVLIVLWLYDVERQFQQYFSNIVAVGCNGGGKRSTRRKTSTRGKWLCHITLYSSPLARVEPTTSVVIGTDCIRSRPWWTIIYCWPIVHSQVIDNRLYRRLPNISGDICCLFLYKDNLLHCRKYKIYNYDL